MIDDGEMGDADRGGAECLALVWKEDRAMTSDAGYTRRRRNLQGHRQLNKSSIRSN